MRNAGDSVPYNERFDVSDGTASAQSLRNAKRCAGGKIILSVGNVVLDVPCINFTKWYIAERWGQRSLQKREFFNVSIKINFLRRERLAAKRMPGSISAGRKHPAKPKTLLVEKHAAIAIDKIRPVAVSFQIIKQRPHAPEQIIMAVADAPVSHVDKSGKAPAVQQNIGQAAIPVNQRIGTKRPAARFERLIRRIPPRSAAGVAKSAS